jgi:hypothetical protein
MQRAKACRFLGSVPSSQRILVTIGSLPGAFTRMISPVGLRPLKTAPGASVRADFLFDAQPSKRCGATAGTVAEPELGSRDRVNRNRPAVAEEKHSLVGRTDDHLVVDVPGASRQEQEETCRAELADHVPATSLPAGARSEAGCWIQKPMDLADT